MKNVLNLQQGHRIIFYPRIIFKQHLNYRKTKLSGSSCGGGDKNLPQGKMENTHKIPIRKKRKIPLQEEEEEQVSENDVNNLSLEDMDHEVDIENIQFNEEENMLQETQQIVLEVATQEEYFSEDESFTIHNAIFDRNSRKLVFEGTSHKNNKGKLCSKYDLSKMPTYQIFKIHKVIGDALKISIDDLEANNAILKENVKELESTLMPPQNLASPLTIAKPGTPDLKLKGSSSLLMVVRKFVEENIKKRMPLIMDAWDVSSKKITSMRKSFIKMLL
jgi:hypothetical protein